MQNIHEKKNFKILIRSFHQFLKAGEMMMRQSGRTHIQCQRTEILKKPDKGENESRVGRHSLEFFLADGNTVAGAFLGCLWFCGGADLHAHHPSLSHHSLPEDMLQSIP